jgi:transposase
VLAALQLPTDRLPTPRADGDHEALRILLCARDELTTAVTAQISRLRALLRDGDDSDRAVARRSFTNAILTALARQRGHREATREQAIRQTEIRRLALAVRDGRQQLQTNRAQLQEIVNDLAPGLTRQPGIGPVCGAQAIVTFSHTGRCRSDAAFAALAGTNPIPPAAAARCAIVSTAVETGH